MAAAPTPPATMHVRVVRPFYYLQRVQPVDARVELPRAFAIEMIAVAKAIQESATAPAGSAPEAPAVSAMQTVGDPADAGKPQTKPKGGRDAG